MADYGLMYMVQTVSTLVTTYTVKSVNAHLKPILLLHTVYLLDVLVVVLDKPGLLIHSRSASS